MQVIAEFFGSGALAAQLGNGAAFSHYFKKLARFAKLPSKFDDGLTTLCPSASRYKGLATS